MHADSRGETLNRRDFPYLYFGAHPQADATVFRVYAPNATDVRLLREGTDWQPVEALGRQSDGVWEITVPEVLAGTAYKYLVRNDAGYLPAPYEMQRIDPFSRQLQVQHGQGGERIINSLVPSATPFSWTHKHLERPPRPMSIYELHLGTFWGGNYRDIVEQIISHVGYLGFTHVQIMPPFQTPIRESWGYLVGCPYAISEEFGSLEDFCALVNRCHEAGIGVVVDVPLGFGIQDWDCGLANYDGTDLYHHAGSRGWNNQWKTRLYNHHSPYVREYLTGICSYLHHELGVDGVRVDAVSSQLFLDYDRGDWDWPRNNRETFRQEDWDLINGLGGDRLFEDRGYWLSEAVDLEALRFFREFHERLGRVAPNLFTIAEESRRVFPRLACPVQEGGLGFHFAQHMGEMHRIRKYLQKPVEERRIEVIENIFLQETPETFVNPMNTHDECANGRTRLITELNSHIQLIGLAALCWLRPGAPMIFQGDEFAEEGWFDINHPLDWSKTGPHAALHQQQMICNIHDLNHLLCTQPALARQSRASLDRIGSNNEQHWFSFVRWGSEKGWESGNQEDHRDDILVIRNESTSALERAAEIYVPADGEYQVIYNSIDERYIGQHDYNRHDPYWRIVAQGHFLYIDLQPHQMLALRMV